ncbi:MAG: DUF1273 domain-containing protein [Ruminococcaceae bacterium]|nr:DUF1273 domain-containing protein [Oscillospiraceae bacterium]
MRQSFPLAVFVFILYGNSFKKCRFRLLELTKKEAAPSKKENLPLPLPRAVTKKGEIFATQQEYFKKPFSLCLFYAILVEGTVRKEGTALKICCFTGHRTVPPETAPTLIKVLDAQLEQLAANGFTEFRAGGARGFDTLAALRVLALRERHPQCRLTLVLPCRDQTKFWKAGERSLFEDILQKADEARYIEERYTTSCMYARNRALVDGSDLCIAYLTENRGGTLYTCAYALKKKVALLNLADKL